MTRAEIMNQIEKLNDRLVALSTERTAWASSTLSDDFVKEQLVELKIKEAAINEEIATLKRDLATAPLTFGGHDVVKVKKSRNHSVHKSNAAAKSARTLLSAITAAFTEDRGGGAWFKRSNETTGNVTFGNILHAAATDSSLRRRLTRKQWDYLRDINNFCNKEVHQTTLPGKKNSVDILLPASLTNVDLLDSILRTQLGILTQEELNVNRVEDLSGSSSSSDTDN